MRAKRNGAQAQTALITGGSGGIGFQIARVLARKGFDLVLVSRKRDTLEASAGQLVGKFGVRVHVFAADLRRAEAPKAIFEFLQNENVPIEVLVNNAGFGLGGEFADTDVRRELDMIQVNIAALTHLTKLFLPPMIRHKSGRVLNIASTAAFQPGPLMAVYYATKAYVLSFSQALAEELRHSGVTVTALCPGATATDFAATAQVTKSRLFSAFGMADPADVAEFGVAAMMHGRRVAIPGIKNKIVAQATRFAPRDVVARISRLIQESNERTPSTIN
jgi:short-subunit dehydrogenase